MKTIPFLLFAALAVVGLLLTGGPASATWGDTMAHHDSDSGSATPGPGQCFSHMPASQTIAAVNPIFKLCAADSHADHWSAEIRTEAFPNTLICSMPYTAVSAQSTFPLTNCTGTFKPGVSYRGIIWYYVGTSTIQHIDKKFVR